MNLHISLDRAWPGADKNRPPTIPITAGGRLSHLQLGNCSPFSGKEVVARDQDRRRTARAVCECILHGVTHQQSCKRCHAPTHDEDEVQVCDMCGLQISRVVPPELAARTDESHGWFCPIATPEMLDTLPDLNLTGDGCPICGSTH